MRKIVFLFLFILSVGMLSAQKARTEPVIPLNSRFILKLLPDTVAGKFTYVVVHNEPYDKVLNLKKASSLFDKNVAPDQIQGVFAYAKFEGNKQIVLVLKSGKFDALNYDLYIRWVGRQSFDKSHVLDLQCDKIVTEVWLYEIDQLLFSDFRVQ